MLSRSMFIEFNFTGFYVIMKLMAKKAQKNKPKASAKSKKWKAPKVVVLEDEVIGDDGVDRKAYGFYGKDPGQGYVFYGGTGSHNLSSVDFFCP